MDGQTKQLNAIIKLFCIVIQIYILIIQKITIKNIFKDVVQQISNQNKVFKLIIDPKIIIYILKFILYFIISSHSKFPFFLIYFIFINS